MKWLQEDPIVEEWKPFDWQPGEPLTKEPDESAIWLQEQEPLLKRFWDYINPMDLVNFAKKTYETTPEMKEASNLEVLDNMSMSLLNAVGGGDTNRFLKWEQEARNRNISPLMYAEPVAGALVIGLMALWGTSAAFQLISANPILKKVVAPITQAIGRALPVGAPGTLQPLYAGFPVEKSLSSAIQASSGLANVGQLQQALTNVLPGVPVLIEDLISKAVSGVITNQDILSIVSKEKAYDVSRVFGKETGIIQVFDEAGKLKRVEAEKPEVDLPEKMVDIEIFRSLTAPQGDALFSEWQTLIAEGEKDRAKAFVKELEALEDTQDSARYALLRIKKKGHKTPKEELFITKKVVPGFKLAEHQLIYGKPPSEVIWFRATKVTYKPEEQRIGKSALGTYFSQDEEVAGSYGTGVEPFSLDIKNPFNIWSTPEEYLKVAELLKDEAYINNYNNMVARDDTPWLTAYKGGINPNEVLNRWIDEYGAEKIRSAMTKAGYDAILNMEGETSSTWGPQAPELAVFDPKSIKPDKVVPKVPIPYDEIAKREGPLMVDVIKGFESAGVNVIQSNLGGTGTYPSLQSTDYEKLNTYIHFNLYDSKTVDKLTKAGFDITEGPRYIDTGDEIPEDIRQLRVGFSVPSKLTPEQVDSYNKSKLNEILGIMKVGKVVDVSEAPKVLHYEDASPRPEGLGNMIEKEVEVAQIPPDVNVEEPVTNVWQDAIDYHERLKLPPPAEVEEKVIPLPGYVAPTKAPLTPRYTARAHPEDFDVSKIVTHYRTLTPKEQVGYETGLYESAENTLGMRALLSFQLDMAATYQDKTGFPLLTEGVLPAVMAGSNKQRYLAGNIKVIDKLKGMLTKEQIIDLDWAMKYDQAIYEIEHYGMNDPILRKVLANYKKYRKAIVLDTEQIEVKQAYRSLLDFMYESAKGDPSRYIPEYVSLYEADWSKVPQKEIWGLYVGKYEPWFMKNRNSIGRVSTTYDIFDLARIYNTASARKMYDDALEPLVDIVSRLPGSKSDYKTPLGKMTRWLKWLKTGQLEPGVLGEISEHGRKAIEKSAFKLFGWILPKDFQFGRWTRQQIYLGTLAGNPFPVIRNFTQTGHNLDMPVEWIIAGAKFMLTTEGKHVFEQSGVASGFGPFLSRAYELDPRASKLKAAQYYTQELPLKYGMLPFSIADVFNRAGIQPAEFCRVVHFGEKYIKGEIDWDTYTKKTDLYGVHPCISQGIKGFLDNDKMDWERYQLEVLEKEPPLSGLERAAYLLSFWRTKTAQYIYQAENRPYLGRQGAIGQAAYQYTSWSIGKIEQQADILGAATRLFKEGKNEAAFYQLYKEGKQIGWWFVVAAIAAGLGIDYKKLARYWGLGWIPTEFGPAVGEAQKVAEGVKRLIVDWKGQSLFRSLEDILTLFDPTSGWRVRVKRSEKFQSEYDKTMTILGFRMEEGIPGQGVDPIELWRNQFKEEDPVERWRNYQKLKKGE